MNIKTRIKYLYRWDNHSDMEEDSMNFILSKHSIISNHDLLNIQFYSETSGIYQDSKKGNLHQ